MEKEFKVEYITFDLKIKGGINEVWDCLINETEQWWNSAFFTSEKTQRFVIEKKVGGRMYEDFGNNEGVLWANVIILDSPQTIEFKGMLTPQFGGPAFSFSKWTLSQEGGITKFTLSDTLMGAIDKNTVKELKKGWKAIFEEGFKPYVEAKAALILKIGDNLPIC